MTIPFLGVEKSFLGRRWVQRPYDERVAEALAQRLDLPDGLARSLSARGIGLDEAPSFLDPRLRDLLPDPSSFKGMEVAAHRMVEGIKRGEKIAVFGDYDVDGATSSALLVRFARAVGRQLRLYIPDRLREGYGPNAEAMRLLAAEGVTLVVCVDCGMTAFEPLAAAKEAGLEVIVLDHHAAAPSLPEAVAVVNPNRLDEEKADVYGSLAAVGVTYLFIIAVNRALREAGYYAEGHKEPDLKLWLDLVALGTVCDVVKLTGLNRAFVSQGLKILALRQNVGLMALADVAGHKGAFDTYALGFILGPRINAGGRVGVADLGSRLLAMEEADLALGYAEKLHQLNAERRDLEAQLLVEAEGMNLGGDDPLIFVASENWHPGVIGIVASRLKEKYNKPAIVIALEGETGKGSGRSIGNIDLGTAILAARQAGLLVNGGGHKMAAGLTVERGKIDALRAFLNEKLARQMEAEPLVPTLTVDVLVAAGALDEGFIKKLESLAPFGVGNPEPRFALADCKLMRANVVGERHVSFIVLQGGKSLRGIAFRAMENALGPALLSLQGKNCHLAGHVRLDTWKGKGEAQLILDDAAAG